MSRINRLTNTLGFQMNIDIEHQLNAMYSPTKSTVHVIIENTETNVKSEFILDRNDTEVIRDFFTHVLSQLVVGVTLWNKKKL